MTEMERLAERVEAATGPDRYLNLAIANAIYGDDLAPPGTSHNYTGSLDAAMMLVPEGWDWSAGTLGNGKGGHSFMRPAGRHYPRVEVDAATPALALTAAALRARAQAKEER